MEENLYGTSLRRARLDAARRLALPELERVEGAAQLIGVTKGYLYKLENGDKKPSFDMLEQIAERYGVMVGDLLPSSAPRGPELDRLIAPLATLPRATRSRLITQMEGLARTLAAEINAANDGYFAAVTNWEAEALTPMQTVTYDPTVSANAAYTPSLKSNGTDEAVPPVAWNNVKPPAHESQNARDSAEAAASSGSESRRAVKTEKKR